MNRCSIPSLAVHTFPAFSASQHYGSFYTVGKTYRSYEPGHGGTCTDGNWVVERLIYLTKCTLSVYLFSKY